MIATTNSSQSSPGKSRAIHLNKTQKEESSDVLFEKAKKGSKKAFESLIEGEKPLLFDFALRMTGDMTRSIEAIQECINPMDPASLTPYKNLFILRQSLCQAIRKTCKSLWHNDTSRLENSFYLQQSNADTENLKDLNVTRPIKIRDFEREYRLLPGLEREALWLKARLDGTPEQVAQVMEIKISEAESHLVHALFRLETKSFGLDPESLVAQLPLHPLPAPVSNVTMDLSMVMQGIKSGQKPPQQNHLSLYFWSILAIFSCLITAGFIFNSEIKHYWAQFATLVEPSSPVDKSTLPGLPESASPKPPTLPPTAPPSRPPPSTP